MSSSGARPPRTATTDAELVLGSEDASLLDIVDNVLNKGVVLSGDLTIALANVDLIYARLSVLLCAADRVLPPAQQTSARKAPAHRRPPPLGWPPKAP
jgi:hypothetical protein